MRRPRVIGMITALAALLSFVVMLCMAAPAQNRSHAAGQGKGYAPTRHQPTAARSLKGEFAPRIIGRANSFIVRGRIIALRGQWLGIETASGERLEFQLSEQTTLIEGNELVSIATMDDIALRLADLRLADEVEVVAERAGPRKLAHIVTRTAQGQPVAQR